MTQSSPRTDAIARKNEHILLQRFNEVPSKNIALATGWHESKVSRLFGAKNDNGKTDAQAIAAMLAELGLTVYPSHWRMSDPQGVDAMLGTLQFLIPHAKPEHFFKDPTN